MKITIMCPKCGSVVGLEETDRTDDICQYCSTKRITIDFDENMLGDTDEEFQIAEQEINQQFAFHLPTFDKTAYEYRLKRRKEAEIELQQIYDEIDRKREDRNNPKCPNCKSTAITAGQRGFSIITGFWGSGNTVNRCAACGHKWKP